MEFGGGLVQVLSNLISQAPVLLVALVGGIVALATWQKHPGVSACVAIAVAIQLLVALISAAVYAILPQTSIFQDMAGEQTGWVYAGMNFVFSLARALAYVLLLFAVFKWRGRGEGSESRAWTK